MKIGTWQTLVLSKSEEVLTLECQLDRKTAHLLSVQVDMGKIAISLGLILLVAFVFLSNIDLLGMGFVSTFGGCMWLGVGWHTARLASTVTFDLRQRLIIIAPKWNLGRKRTYRFDEIQSLHATKRLGLRFPYIGTSRFQYDYWKFLLVLNNSKKIGLGEGYPPERQDDHIQKYMDEIGSSTGILVQINFT